MYGSTPGNGDGILPLSSVARLLRPTVPRRQTSGKTGFRGRFSASLRSLPCRQRRANAATRESVFAGFSVILQIIFLRRTLIARPCRMTLHEQPAPRALSVPPCRYQGPAHAAGGDPARGQGRQAAQPRL